MQEKCEEMDGGKKIMEQYDMEGIEWKDEMEEIKIFRFKNSINSSLQYPLFLRPLYTSSFYIWLFQIMKTMWQIQRPLFVVTKLQKNVARIKIEMDGIHFT